MSHRSDPASRRATDELGGTAGCIAFGVFLVIELAVAVLAGFICYGLARAEPIDVGHEIGIILAIIVALGVLAWIDWHCRRVTGHSAGELVLEALAWW